jgi:short-subunit dehydrogenase
MTLRTLHGSTAVITGATSGIGRATARVFAQAGARVVAAGRREERLTALVADIVTGGGEALAIRTDVAELSQVERLVTRAVERFGRIDTLVNNAGVGLVARFAEQSLADVRRVMEVNFWGAVSACRAAVPRMRAQPSGGVIINIASILGKRGMPFQTAYCASKFALAGFSAALWTELMAEGIVVSTIFPGAVESEIWDAAANQTGLELPQTAVPKFPAAALARLIVQAARCPQPEIVVALDAQGLHFWNTLMPGALDFALGQGVPWLEGRHRHATAPAGAAGNLYRPHGRAGRPARSRRV